MLHLYIPGEPQESTVGSPQKLEARSFKARASNLRRMLCLNVKIPLEGSTHQEMDAPYLMD